MTPDLRRNLAMLVLMLVAVVAGIVWFGRRGERVPGGVSTADTAAVARRIELLQSRLRDLRVAQDTFHRHYGVYGRSVDQMRFDVPPDLTIEIIAHSAAGWTAQGYVRGSNGLCAIFVGDSAEWAFAPAYQSGVPACTR